MIIKENTPAQNNFRGDRPYRCLPPTLLEFAPGEGDIFYEIL